MAENMPIISAGQLPESWQAACYAAANGLLDWPDEVEAIQRTERAKKLSLDRVMKLLAQMNHTFSGRASAEQAKLLLEGYSVHDWVSDNSLVFRTLASDKQDALGALDDISDHAREAISPFAARLHQLGRILGLSVLEQDILAFAGTESVLAACYFTVRSRDMPRPLWPRTGQYTL